MKNTKELFYNGDIITLEDKLYVEALLVEDGKISGVGSKEELIGKAGAEVELRDLKGRTLMPSFIDAHSHFSGYASTFTQVDLSEAISFEEISEAIKKFIVKNHIPEGKWIQANGYDQNFLKEKAHPTLELLDGVASKNPLIVKHKSGHMGVMNTAALEALNINENTEAPDGGVIGKKDGRLTGYVEENAFMKYIQEIPMISNEEFMASLMKAQKAYESYGITTVQEGFVVEQLAPILEYLSKAGMLELDLIGYMDISRADQLKDKFSDCLGKYDNHVKMGGYKTFLDGSPQGRTAWMRTPYKGEDKSYKGYGTQSDDEIREKLEKALKENIQIIVHCNGDAACEQYITQYKMAMENTGIKKDIRPVIIHAQLLGKDQLEEVKNLKMILSFFVAHVYHWGDIHIENFGMERAEEISPAASALEEGIIFTFHQDTPVIEPDMLETIWCAVNRITKEGVVLGDSERISPLEALKSVTKNAAYQYFEEDIKGTLKPGKLADMVILDRNILKVDPLEIRDIKVMETIKEGKTIYKNC